MLNLIKVLKKGNKHGELVWSSERNCKMIQLHPLIADLVFLLDDSGFCSNTQMMETSIFSSEQFAFKIRTIIFSSYLFQIRSYVTAQVGDQNTVNAFQIAIIGRIDIF